ncbi:MAG: cupin domain-containing protein [Sneathiella sp.]|nr:cupin domain-containing protein [Sneathiella sp.]
MSMILDAMPSAADFFRLYWNKKPFVVRGMISAATTSTLIDADHLAGLAMEEEVKSRLVRKGGKPSDWRCDYGPFEAKVFDELGESDWSLLVQNIDQYHEETAELLKQFNFCPRWLLDDIMVSFSPKGGTVGEHVDSYHVFLIQGMGKRCWKVAKEAIQKEEYIEDIPLEILKDAFDGEEVIVTEGDIIYIPPKFAHQGVSLEPSLTYSIGFLGPTLSEMMSDFSHFIEEHHENLPRYLGQNLTETAAPFEVGKEHIQDLKSFMTGIYDESLFNQWITHYFSSPTHIAEENLLDEEDVEVDVAGLIEAETELFKPPSVKIMLTPLKDRQNYSISIGNYTFQLPLSELPLVSALASEEAFSAGLFRQHPELLQELLVRDLLR